MPGRKRKQNATTAPVRQRQVRPRHENNSRWNLNEPENWSTSELFNKLREANIILPSNLKKAQLVQIFKDNVLNKDRSDSTDDSREIQVQDREVNVQYGELNLLPASSINNPENEAGRMSTNDPFLRHQDEAGRKQVELSNAVQNIQRSVEHLANEISTLKLRGVSNQDNEPSGSGNFTIDTPTPRISSDSVPHIETVSSNLRNQIMQGKDVNLALLLMPHEIEENSLHDSDGRFIVIKNNTDPRLQRNLTLSEFIVAFTKYRNILCEFFPERRSELDAYLRDIIEMASTTKGSAFYDYHKAFSARASTLLQQRNIRIDWAIRDTKLFTTIFAGQTINRCEMCNSVTHSSHFCPRIKHNTLQSQSSASQQNPQTSSLCDVQGRPRIKHKGKEICNNFNSVTGCQRKACNLVHICSECKFNNHAAPTCNKLKAKQSITSEKA
ncbi:uncharacterized protein LOC130048272 [Ostrea edulis]|uniref:uncharacterized protein LOC130048272 n=1 Tax=Ostrea edulis TaxID=37623 RepID=UPI0024AF37C3|nr:uncharacterized protein LOC130048272 [Ostrea edulis]